MLEEFEMDLDDIMFRSATALDNERTKSQV